VKHVQRTRRSGKRIQNFNRETPKLGDHVKDTGVETRCQGENLIMIDSNDEHV
jgi:hypothetical protein